MRFLLRLPCILLFFCSSTSVTAQSDTLMANHECRIREGIPTSLQKLQAGQQVTIGYFGGSITEAGNGWREKSLNELQQRFPKASIKAINAAIGGTGSNLGVFRLKQHVLVHQPDLVFVEFAVNDSNTPTSVIHKSMEGIVRQIWRQNPKTDICFIYTLNEPMVPTLLAGNLPNSVVAMEQIAQHYGIPSIHMGLELIAKARQGEVVWKGAQADYPGKIVFSPDGTHPYSETGHAFYATAFARSLTKLMNVTKPVAHRLPKPFDTENWEAAKMVSLQDIARSQDWQVLFPETDSVAHQLRNRFTYLIKSSKPGATLTINFTGKVLGVYDVVGPNCGQYNVSVDDQPDTDYPRFDSFATYYRSSFFFVPIDKPGKHTVTLRVSPKQLDKAAILKTRNKTIDNPAAYQENACYASQLLIVGDLTN